MYQTNQNKTLRSALLLGAASAAALSLAAPAMAQDNGGVETVVVTGSRIPQQGLYSSSPVTAVGQQEIQYQGTVNVETLLNNLPSVVADQTEGVTNGSSGTADVDLRGLGPQRTLVLVDGKRLNPGDAFTLGGVADLNMIPANLIDHVEVLTGGASSTYGSDALSGVVNFITRKDFEGVEVSGQYTIDQNDNDNDFPKNCPGCGNILDQYQIARPQVDIWDGQSEDIHLLLGTNTSNGKGNVTLYMGYQHIEPILENARDFSACSAGDTGYVNGKGYTYHSCGGSSTSPQGKFVSIDLGNYNSVHGFSGPNPGKGILASPGYLNPTNYAATNGEFEQNGTFSGGQLATAPFNPQGLFNYAPFNYLQRPDERYTAGASGHYEVNKAFDVYGSVMFMDDHTLAQVAPGGAFQTPFTVNCGNPNLSAQEEQTLCPAGVTSVADGLPFTGTLPADNNRLATVLIGRRSLEAGTRQDDLRHTDYRLVVGAKGDLGSGWSYDLSAQYGVSVYADAQEGYFSQKNFQNALLVNPDGTCQTPDPACVPINVFQAPVVDAADQRIVSSPLTQSMLNYVTTNGLAQGQTDESVVHLDVTGDLGNYGIQSPWAKSGVGINVGTEYRQEHVVYTPDQELIQGDLMGLGGARTPISGHYNVAEAFGEVRVPLVQNTPFFEDLSVNAGYRYSSYSISGATNTYKAGLEWQVVDDLKLRASYDHAVRAPNVSELFATPDVVLFGGQDACGNNGNTNAPPSKTDKPSTGYYWAQVQAFCIATGLPNFGNVGSAYGNILPCPASQCNQQTSGNVNLRPEVSDTKSVGIVLTPTFLDGFTMTVDYFDIKVARTIGGYGAAFLLSTCYGSVGTDGLGTPSPACSLIHRDPATGFIWTPAGYVNNPTNNLGFEKTSGVDVEAHYAKDLADFGWNDAGSFNVGFYGTYTQHFTTEPLPSGNEFYTPGVGAVYDCAGYWGAVCGTPTFKWRHQARFTWTSPWDFDLSLNWRYLSSVKIDNLDKQLGSDPEGLPGVLGFENIRAYNYFDLSGDWNVREGVTIRAGVNNVFDNTPPINGLAEGNGNTLTGTYDSVGRYVFVSGTIKY